MNLIRVYTRVLALLSDEARLAWLLALANLALAGAQFAEPVLFGRIIDALTKSLSTSTLAPLIAAWVGFGLFTILCGAFVALHADRLAHRRRQVVLSSYFEHVLQLPLSFHGTAHSGRLMKVMIAGTDALWMIWVDFFRDYFSALALVFELLPFSLLLNWQLGLLLIMVCCLFGVLTGLVIRKTEGMQQTVERHYSDLAERASDALGNVALVQGFARVEAEVRGLRALTNALLAAQIPVLSWWALVAVLTRASTTLTMLGVLLLGTWLNRNGQASIGDIMTFMFF